MRLSSRSTAFSLMELLLTVAVLAVLITLSLRVGQSIRRRSDDVRCVANLRSSGQAILNYLNDQNGKFFPKKYWFQYNSYRASTNRGMREYFNVEPDLTPSDERLWVDTMLTCPAVLRKYTNFANTMFRRGYGINYYLFLTVDDKPISGFKNFRAIPNPAAMWGLSDAAIGGGADNVGAKEPLGSINDNTANAAVQYLPVPHAGRKNHFFFLDGHIAGLTLEEIRNPAKPREFWGNTALAE